MSTPPFQPSSISSRQRRDLRSMAHSFEPLVHVGHEGVTPGVLGAVDQALLDHELIKVRLHEPEDKKAMASALATGAGATLCGLVGHTVVLYRPHPEKPTLCIPTGQGPQAQTRAKTGAAAGTRRARSRPNG